MMMTKFKLLSMIVVMMATVSGFSQENPILTKARFGTEKQDLYNYFQPFFKQDVPLDVFKRFIFKVGITDQGEVNRVEAVNHPAGEIIEQKIAGKINEMTWFPKTNPEPVSCELYLIFVHDHEGKLTIEIRA